MVQHMNDREKEMIKIEQGTSFDGERRCVIASLTTAEVMTVMEEGIRWRAFAGRHFSLSTTGSKLISPRDNVVCEYFQHVSSLARR